MRLILSACAKINLTLEILGRRDDGYHEISSVLQTIDLSDTLSFEYSESLELACNVPNLISADNLVLKAASLLKETTGFKKGAYIHLSKAIPVSSGLGSGATDAAATLVGLNTLWELALPLQKLAELASSLGSDVTFFIYGGTALSKGRGEIITPLRHMNEGWVVLLNPPIEPVSNKTGRLYSQLNEYHFTAGHYTAQMVDHMYAGEIDISSLLFNGFEKVAYDFFPGLSDYYSLFMNAGAKRVTIAGAGPTLYTLVLQESEGKAIFSRLKDDGLDAYLVKTVEKTNTPCTRGSQC